MGSSSRNSIYDEIRKKWVAATPEEVVRQRLIRKMTEELGFPKALIAVEKELKQLPHLTTHNSLPDRRADLICFAPGIHQSFSLYPLLLIECKAETLDQKAIEQAIGYNSFVQAYFVALVNDREIRCGYYSREDKGYRFLDYLPSYEKLVSGT